MSKVENALDMSLHEGKDPELSLSLMFSRVTEAAALASARWLGRGQKETADGAAVKAMRMAFKELPVSAEIIIGEGEKDNAPMLYKGEKLGSGGKEIDIAVDPIEGTNLVAYGKDNALSVIAGCEKGKMFDPGPSFYMEKLVVTKEAYGSIDIEAPVSRNLKNIAKALDKKVEDLVVFVLDKPRHQKLISDIRKAGALIRLRRDGDVAGALSAAAVRGDVDVLMGSGGTPEGVLAAAAVRAMGGEMQARINPQIPEEMRAVLEAGYDLKQVLNEKDLIQTDDCWFSATGISGGELLRGVRFDGHQASTHSMTIRGKTGTTRFIETVLDSELLYLPERK
ncbi:MAG: class II fructose-bisphosphatase [Alphaproteobacteria bacterium]